MTFKISLGPVFSIVQTHLGLWISSHDKKDGIVPIQIKSTCDPPTLFQAQFPNGPVSFPERIFFWYFFGFLRQCFAV